MHGGEIATWLLPPQPLDNFRQHIVAVVIVGPIIGQASDARLGGEPVSGSVDVEKSGSVGKTPEGIAEGGDGFTGLCAAEAGAPVINSRVLALIGGSRAHVGSAGHPPRRRIPSEVGDFLIDGQRDGRRSIDVVGDHRVPSRLQVAHHFKLNRAVVDGDAGGKDHQAAIFPFP